MANTLKFKRGLLAGLPTAAEGEPLFTTDTADLYIGTSSGNQRFQKYIASGATTQILRGDGSLYTFPLNISSPSNGQVLKYNGTSWVNDSDAGITGSGTTNYLPKFTGATTLGNSQVFDNGTNIGINTSTQLSPSGFGYSRWIGINAGTSGDNNMAIDLQGSRTVAGGFVDINFWHQSTSNRAYIQARRGSTDSQILLSFVTSGGNGMTLDQSGNLGVGITPTQRLDVSGYIRATSGFVGNSGLQLWADNSSIAAGARLTTGGNFIINNPSSDNGLRFQVTGDGYFSGKIGIGISSFPEVNLALVKNITGGTLAYGMVNQGAIQSDVTSIAILYQTNASTQSANFALSNIRHYSTFASTTFSNVTAGGSVTNQFGYFVDASLTGATNNFGFYGNIASGTGRWNLYMNGTAANYLAGNLGVGFTGYAWPSATKAIDLGTVGGFSTDNNYVAVSNNWYWSGSQNLYKISDFATQYVQQDGLHIWTNAPSGTAGTSATFTERMRLDASGNLGLGVQPSAWSITPALQVVRASIYNQGDDGTYVTSNGYYNAGWNYIGNSTATQYQMLSGQHRWFTAPSGTAGNAITFTQAMTLDASGRLSIGSGSVTSELLQVNGTMRVSGAATFSSSVTAGSTVKLPGGGSVGLIVGARTTMINNNYAGHFDAIVSIAGASSLGGLALGFNTTRTNAQQVVYLGASDSTNPDFILQNAAGTTITTISATGAATFSSSVTGASFIPTSATAPSNGMYLAATNTLAFATSTTEAIRITSSGSVGINSPTTNSERLVVRQTTNNVYSAGIYTSASTGSSYGLKVQAGTNSSDVSMQIFGQAGSTYLLLRGDNNLGFGTSLVGATGTNTLSVFNGTAPSSNLTDTFQMYSNDVTAGNAAPHFRTENGAVIKLYQETTAVGNSTISVGGGNAVLDDTEFDGYTLRQVVRALRNQGILQ